MPPSPKGGLPRLDGEQALNGIPFVLRTGMPREELPLELGHGSGMTCWRRLNDWQAVGMWHRLHWLGSKRHLVTNRRGIALICASPALIAMTRWSSQIRSMRCLPLGQAGQATPAADRPTELHAEQELRPGALPRLLEALRHQRSHRPQGRRSQ